jgi:NADPH:quinone reductase-like Zn-dependent oxidoreductase
MRSLYITRHGGPEVLQLRNAPDPVPGAGEVLIEVARSGLNFADIAARVGLYPDAPKPPAVVGYEVAGTVKAIGPGVSQLRIGDSVLALTRFGGHASCVVVRELQAARFPPGMSFDEAATLPVNYTTAFHMLHHIGQIRPFDRVLIHMAAGGVGMAAIQLCRLVEGVEIFGTASASKHDALRAAGVHHPIDYRAKDYAEEVRRLTDGKGVQLVLDPLGGKDWEKGYRLLAPTGHLIAFGWANMVNGQKRSWMRVLAEVASMKRYSPLNLMDHNRSVSGVNLGHLWGLMEMMRRELEALLVLYQQKKISPKVDRVFPLSAGAQAHRYLQERHNIGKVLLDCQS